MTQGVYLWGGVGRGKSWLMNLFYEELPIEQKSRVHFHHFMLDIHDEIGPEIAAQDLGNPPWTESAFAVKGLP